MERLDRQSNLADSSSTIVRLWNQVALDAIREERPEPTVISRSLHILHAVIYDTWSIASQKGRPAYSKINSKLWEQSIDITEAINAAAYYCLKSLFPEQNYRFFRLLKSQNSSNLVSQSGKFGKDIAAQILAIKLEDGSFAEYNYKRDYFDREQNESNEYNSFNPNEWYPLKIPNGAARDTHNNPTITKNKATYKWQIPVTPHWASVKSFALKNPDQFRPVAPPRLGQHGQYIDAKGKITTEDKAYKKQLRQLVNISGSLNYRQKAKAEYWADGPQTTTPVGHWNEIAQDLAARDDLSLEDDVKLFFLLNNALFDTGISVWDAKYNYNFIRPQQAIRNLYEGKEIKAWTGANNDKVSIEGEHWQPYQDPIFITPAFPEYTSGHSAFSYAAASVLSRYLRSDQFYDGKNYSVYDVNNDSKKDLLGEWKTNWLKYEDQPVDVTLRWPTLWDAAAEAGHSRLLGGIHIQDSDLRGRDMGLSNAKQTWQKTNELFVASEKNLKPYIIDNTKSEYQINNYSPGKRKYIFMGFENLTSFDDLNIEKSPDSISLSTPEKLNVEFNVDDVRHWRKKDVQFRSRGLQIKVFEAINEKTNTSIVEQSEIKSVLLRAKILTSKPLKTLALDVAGNSQKTTINLIKKAKKINSGYKILIDENQINKSKEITLKDGLYQFNLKAADKSNNKVNTTFSIMYDKSKPKINGIENAITKKNIVRTTPTHLTLKFNEPISFDPTKHKFQIKASNKKNTSTISSVSQPLPGALDINFSEPLRNGKYKLEFGAIQDLAGNTLNQKNLFLIVDALTKVTAITPFDEETNVIINRPIKIEFDQPIKPKTINKKSVRLTSGGENIPIKYSVSNNHKFATLYPTSSFPSSTRINLQIKGDKVRTQQSSKIDANSDGKKGGTLKTSFSTLSSSRIDGTNIEGFIFDANYTDKRGMDIPLQGVNISVVGQDEIKTKTDKKGRFFLKNLPIPIAYLNFDASNVKNRNNINYGTIVKPVDTEAGKTAGLGAKGKPFNIYFSALAKADTVKLKPSKVTEVKIGEKGLENLKEVLPNIGTKEWQQLKVIIPPNSLKTDQGEPVKEVSIMAFPPERIPAPVPLGMDPDYVFTVKAESATVVEGNAQVELPNIENLKPGEKTFIMSFDHDDGQWKETGTAVVSPDGKKLITEGSTGVNTLGWKFPGKRNRRPLFPPRRRRPPEDDDDCPPGSESERNGNTDTEKTTYTHRQNGLIIGDGGLLDTLYQEFVNPYTTNDDNIISPPPTCKGQQKDVDPWDVDYEIMVKIDPVIWEFMDVKSSGFTINPNDFLHRQSLFEGEDALSLEIVPKKIDEMFPGGYQGLDKNIYYSGVVEIEKSTFYDSGQPTETDIEKFTLHRLVNATDLQPDREIEFFETTGTDDPNIGFQYLNLELKTGSHEIDFEYDTNNGLIDIIPNSFETQPTDLLIAQTAGARHLKGNKNKIVSELRLKEILRNVNETEQVKDVSIPLISNIVPRQKLRIESADFTSAMNKILADPETLTTEEKLAWPALLASKVKLLPNGNVKLLPNGKPDWDVYRENKRTKINRIKSESYYTDTAIIGKILDRAKQLFAEQDIIMDIGLGNDPKAVNINFKASELDDDYKWERDAGLAVGSLESNDIDVSNILNINNSFNNHMKTHEALQHINKKKDGQIDVYLATILNFAVLNNKGKAQKLYRAFPEPEQRFIEVMAFVFVHEMGHHLGLPHPFSDAGLFDSDWANDPMSYPKYMTSWPSKFTEDYGSFARIATRSSITPANLASVLNILNVGGRNNFVDQSIFSEFLFEDDDHEIEFKPTVPHHLAALTKNNQFVSSVYQVTDTIGGSKFKEIEFKLINLGFQPIKKLSILNDFDAPDFQVKIDKFKAIEPLDSVNVKLKLTDDVIKSSKKLLTFETDLNHRYNFLIDLNVKYTEPKISLNDPIRNFGGVDFDRPDISTQALEIKNQGDKILKIFNISIDNTNQFSFDTNLDENLIIPPHSSHQILVEFKPDSPGLHHATLSIQSNDSKAKMLKLPLNGTGYSSSSDYHWGNDYIYLNTNNFLNRQMSDDQGVYDLFAPSDSDYTFKIFDPQSGLVAVSEGKAQLNPQFSSSGPSLSFAPSVTLDTDGDGLTDEIEEIIGSSPTRVDSNKDGLSDYNAVGLGLNPLDGFSSTTGIISSTQISGSPVDFVVANLNSVESSLLGFVATEQDGLHVIDYQEVKQPIKVAHLPIDDSLTTIELLTHTQQVAIGGKNGLHLVDFSKPDEPVLIASHSFSYPIVAMVKLSELLVVATKSSLMVVNPQTGSILAEDSTLSSISSLATQGNQIYAIKNQNQLVSLEFVDSELNLLDSVGFPKATIRTKPEAKKVFVVNEVAYISNGLEIENVPKFREQERGGFLTYNISNPRKLKLISNIDTPPILSGNLETVSDGSGIVLVAGGIAGVEVHDGKDASKTYNLQTTYDVEGRALSAQLAGSYGFVSTSASQMLAINLLGPDLNGAEPDIEFDWHSLDQDDSLSGIQVEEGSILNILPLVSDDFQMKHVSLYRDNVVHEIDIVPPYDFRVNVPKLSKERKQLQLGVSATDTGLNVSQKDISTLQITPDKTAPKVLNRSFGDRVVVLGEPTLLEIIFSESMSANSIKKNFASFIHENGSKVKAFPKLTHRWDLDNSLLSVSIPSLKKGSHQLSIELSSAKDNSGNRLHEDLKTIDIVSMRPTIEWNAPKEATWSDLNNWSKKRKSKASDIVAIDSRKLKARAKVSLMKGDHTARSLYLNGHLLFDNERRASDKDFKNTTLNLKDFYLDNGRFEQYENTLISVDKIFMSNRSDFRLFSGIVKKAEFNNESPIGIHSFQSCVIICGPSLVEKRDTQLHGVTFNGHVDFAPDTDDFQGNVGLTVFGGLTINDKLVFSSFGEEFARFGFWGEQKVSGSGEIILSSSQSLFDSYADNRLVLIPQIVDIDEALVFDRSIIIRGSGFIGVNSSEISGGHVAIKGEVVAEMGDLILETIDNAGENLLLNPISGDIWLSQAMRNATLKYGSYAEGLDKIVNRIRLGDLEEGPGTPSSQPIELSSIQVDVDLVTEQSIDIRDDFELNKSLTLQAGGSFRPKVSISNVTEINGRGVIRLLAPNKDAESRYQNDLYDFRFSDQNKELSEVLTFGEGLDVIGTGRISVESLLGETDYLRILGPITASNGVLEIESLDNGDQPITLSHADGGAVHFEDAVKNVQLTSDDGSISEANPILFTDSVLMENVVLDVHAKSTENSLDIAGNFELNSTLSLVPERFSSSKLNIIGPDALTGTGTILLNRPDSTESNQAARYSLRFEGISDLSETFTIPSEFEIRGTGRVETSFGFGGNQDKINLLGTLVADGGLLEIRSLDPVVGSLRATSDGLLDFRGDLELTPTSSVHLDLGDPDGLINQPKINVSGSALLGGGLVLQFAEAHQPVLGDEYLIAASSEQISDDFDSINVVGLSDHLDVSVSNLGQTLVATIISS